jgi:hypothetical protein
MKRRRSSKTCFTIDRATPDDHRIADLGAVALPEPCRSLDRLRTGGNDRSGSFVVSSASYRMRSASLVFRARVREGEMF